MITFPPEYVKIKYPGYFWNVNTQQLYSIKSGKVKPLKLNSGNWLSRTTGRVIGPHYQVSVEGVKRYILIEKLKQLAIPTTNEVVDIF